MNTILFAKLKPHIGHHIACVSYGSPENPADVCIECEECNEVLLSAESFDDERNYREDIAKVGLEVLGRVLTKEEIEGAFLTLNDFIDEEFYGKIKDYLTSGEMV